MSTNGTILYLLVLPAAHSGEFSPFQGFSLNTVFVCDAIRHICTLPASIWELFATREDVIRMRASGAGGYAVAPLEVEFLSQFELDTDLICIISDVTSRSRVNQLCQAHAGRQWLHVTTDSEARATPLLWTLSRDFLRDWALKVLAGDISPKELEQLVARAELVGTWQSKSVNAPSGCHNVTSPTELALASLGVEMNGAQPLVGAQDQEYAAALAITAQELRRVREEALAGSISIPGTPVLIVSVPSVYRSLSARRYPRTMSRAFRAVVREILRQGQYIAMRESGQRFAAVLKDPVAQGALQMRAGELNCYTSALSIAAASLFSPVLRCPPQTDRVRDLLVRLAGIIRGKNPAPERISRMAAKVGEALRATVPEPILAEINNCRNQGVKFIGDTPLELLPLDGVPLALCCITSRLPTLPGNLLMRHSLLRRSLFLSPAQFQKLLLVRAFSADDPIRDALKVAVETFMARSSHPSRLIVADVSSKEEFIDAFNGFDGVIAVFDGHGSQDPDGTGGIVSIGSIKLNPFELYAKLRVPPILILSACETYTFEGYESSVASAFLLMGCDSVLGTLAPIDAFQAAALVARFVFRLSDFLPLIEHVVPWSQVVSGMLRMTYVTDLLHAMKARYSLAEERFKKLHNSVQLSANLDINSLRADWLERAFDSISQELAQPRSDIVNTWREKCYFTETLRYIHLGQPEHIFITPDSSPSTTSGFPFAPRGG